MRLDTLVLFLIGDRQAILDLAADRRALWIGLLFVLSAGFAREYDGVDLLREPWHLIIPLGVSLAASFLLFLVACGRLFDLTKTDRPQFWNTYRSFLTLFWMTAPLAWLYAIPYERFLSSGEATTANLWTLAFVAAWRVLLMTRAVSVITGRGFVSSFFLVMVFADAVALAAVYFMPKPVVSFMGGVRLSDSEAAVHGATFAVTVLGVLSAPVWGIGGLFAFFNGEAKWQVPVSTLEPASSGRGPLILAVLSLLIWLPILPRTQGEQRLRARAEQALKAGHLNEALDLMSAREPSDYPPHWDPPPRIGYHESSPHILDVMEVLITRDVAPWVREVYLDKFNRYLLGPDGFFNSTYRGPKLARIVRLLQRLPNGPELADKYLGYSNGDGLEMGPGDEESVKALLELAAKVNPKRLHQPKKDTP